jgi:CelD/BcsL family acetyltransferase involved in cellulose biosynthesis
LRLHTEIITKKSEFIELEPEWRSLFDRCSAAPPFLSPDWLMPWWEVFGGSSEPFVVLARRGDELCGLLPTRLYEGQVYFIGHGLSDQLDALVTEPAVAETLWEALSSFGLGGQLVDLPANSPLLPFCKQSEPVSVSPAVDLACWKMKRRAAANLRYSMKRLHRLGSVELRVGVAEETADCVDGLIDLHTRRWRANGQTGVLASWQEQAFHRRAAPRLIARGLARFYTLVLNRGLAGVLYALHRCRTTYYYLSGYDPDLSHVSPGSCLIAQALEHARLIGDTTFDFLRGSEPHKYTWGATDRHQYVAFLT